MNRLILLALPLFFLFGCTKEEKPTLSENDFEGLMGKNLPGWSYVQTKEDFENLQFFQKVYERNLPLLKNPLQEQKIPKVIHFIWIGPKSFPRESVDNIRSWIAKHPDWKIKFWTDRERPLPHPSMEWHDIRELAFLKLADCYHKSDNYGEKSDLLRYEILYQEGGIYVDHDVKCLHAFDSLHASYDLFCGLEVPFKTSLSSSVLPTNNIVGSRPGHPVLKECLQWLQENWDLIEKDYPGRDREATIDRVSHRTFLALGLALKKLGNEEGNHDMVFPAFYFNAPNDRSAILARHLYAGSWFENESVFEKTTRERLMYLSKKVNKILLACGVLSGLNLLGFVGLFLLLKKRKNSSLST